ncbi:MAG: hypothetical protein J6C53_02815 [Clostridia bacterium]|nr:hypothetical protein [Clostridia bacterium]
MKDFYFVYEYIEYYIYINKLTKRQFCKLSGIKLKILRMIKRKDYSFTFDNAVKISLFLGKPLKKLIIYLS